MKHHLQKPQAPLKAQLPLSRVSVGIIPIRTIQYYSGINQHLSERCSAFRSEQDSGSIILIKYVYPSGIYLAYMYSVDFLVYLYSGTWYLFIYFVMVACAHLKSARGIIPNGTLY